MVGHIGNYLFYVLAARALSPAEFADVSAMTALATIAFMPASGVQAAVARDTAALIAAGRSEEADGLARWLAGRLAVLQAGLLAVLLVATPAAVAVLDLSARSVWLTGAVWLVLGLGLQVGLGPLQGRELFGAVGAVLAGPQGALRPVVLLPGVAVAGVAGALGALVAVTVLGLAGVLAVLWRALRNGHGRPVALTGTLPALAALTAFASLTNADVLAAKIVLDATDAGLYSSAALLGKIALYAPSALALVLLPKVTSRLQSGLDIRGPALSTLAATLGTGLLVTGAILVAPSSLVTVVFGPEYSAAYGLAAPIAAVMTLASLLQVHLMVALASGNRRTVLLTAGAAVLQVTGLTLLAETARDVVLVSALATAAALLLHELVSPFGTLRLLRRRGRGDRSLSSAGTSPASRSAPPTGRSGEGDES
ncbi:lipopolysaccharide biosynthesis protein [Blastococcus deserti]|uniref:Lipopolysaccharide biosynthesis protein n=1 Tax=Blastococcus deserti TaxID=2259033 RepID=A0ABW4X5V7_9ACTN